ncbi:hypothetical protein SRABI84_03897 [Peribacillus simplex]|nr:hypothetical protein SRABI84_03897 [Peribacillus simplex]
MISKLCYRHFYLFIHVISRIDKTMNMTMKRKATNVSTAFAFKAILTPMTLINVTIISKFSIHA